RDELKAAVDKATQLSLEFVDASNEGLYGMESAVPKNHRQDSVFVDIGSSNTKLGCLTGTTYNPVEVPYGSITLRKAVPEGDYPTALQSVVRSQLAPAYDTQRMNTPCLSGRGRFYMSGGAVWATATFAHPEAVVSGFVQLTRKDIDGVQRRLEDGT